MAGVFFFRFIISLVFDLQLSQHFFLYHTHHHRIISHRVFVCVCVCINSSVRIINRKHLTYVSQRALFKRILFRKYKIKWFGFIWMDDLCPTIVVININSMAFYDLRSKKSIDHHTDSRAHTFARAVPVDLHHNNYREKRT